LSLLQDDGGGGGGDGWGWERTARNLLPNAVFLGMYFAITSYGGDGWGGWGGFFGELLFVSSFSAACVGLLCSSRHTQQHPAKVSWRLAMGFGERCFVSSMRWGWG
jgi:hypothetical protein